MGSEFARQGSGHPGIYREWPEPKEALRAPQLLGELYERLSIVLEHVPVGTVVLKSGALTVTPFGRGFPISVAVLGPHDVIVSCGGWSDDCYSWDQIEFLIVAAICGGVRLTKTSLGGSPWKYSIECIDGRGWWRTWGQMQYLRLRLFWLKQEIEYCQYPVLVDNGEASVPMILGR